MESSLVSLSNELSAGVERTARSVVAVHARPRINTSGIVWRKNLILTSSEGIRFDEGIQVLFGDGRQAAARLRGNDPGTDIAILETDTGDITPAEFLPEEGLKAGQLALAVGRTTNTGPIASFGIISGVSSEWKTWRGGKVDPFVRLDLSAYPTSSGGAAVDPGGKLIGIVSTGLSRSSVLAITRKTVERVGQQLLDRGYAGRGYIGIALQPVALPAELKESLRLDQESAIMVLGVEPSGPAGTAGVILGDILVAAAGRAITDPDELAGILDDSPVGKDLSFRVIRAGTMREIAIRVGERPRKVRRK